MSSLIYPIIITLLSQIISSYVPLLGNSIVAIVLGMLVAYSPLRSQLNFPLIKKISNYLLKYGIVIMGLSLSFNSLSNIGIQSLIVTTPLILLSFIVTHFIGKWLNLSTNTRLLIGMGTAICGGSAIAAAAPIIEANDEEIGFAIATIFLFNLIALFIFTPLGHLLHYSNWQFGIFAGSAINDTSSVVAAGFAYSEQAGEFATIVKLMRTLMIVPTCLALLYRRYHTHKDTKKNSLAQIKHIIPQFIIWFVFATIIATFIAIPDTYTHFFKQLTKLSMTMALSCIGLTLDFKQLRHAGIKSLILGGITWGSLIIGSIVLIYLFF